MNTIFAIKKQKQNRKTRQKEEKNVIKTKGTALRGKKN